MIILKGCFMRENKMNLNILKIVKTLFLIWTLKNYDEMGISDEPSENFFYIDKIPNVLNNRLLAKYEIHDKGREKGLTGVLSQNITYNQNKSEASGITTYEQLSKRRSNNSEIYQKNYRKKHVKKKGLLKFDNYFEKKVFDQMDFMYEFLKNRKNGKIFLKKEIFNKYNRKFLLFGLLPIIGLIFPVLFNGDKDNPGILNWCSKDQACSDGTHRKGVWIHDTKDVFENIETINLIYFCVSLITCIFMFIYTIIKVIKYIGLKNGKDSMRAKEYFHVCKELFSNK